MIYEFITYGKYNGKIYRPKERITVVDEVPEYVKPLVKLIKEPKATKAKNMVDAEPCTDEVCTTCNEQPK